MNTTAPKPSPLGRGLSALFGDTDSSYAPRAAQPAHKQNAAAQPAHKRHDADQAFDGYDPALDAQNDREEGAAQKHYDPKLPPEYVFMPPPTDAEVAARIAARQAAAPPQTPLPNTNPRGFRRMAVGMLEPGAFQPRRHFDADALKGLADSIRERGVLEPLLVRPLSGRDACEIVAGERRWRAAQMAGVHDVPVIIRDMTDKEALEFGLIENVQRQDLSPLEEAMGYQRLMDEFSHTQEGLARVVGKSRPHIANMLRMLTLPDAVKTMIAAGGLSFGHARALVVAKNPGLLAEQIVKKGLNVRQAEELVRREGEPHSAPKAKAAPEANADIVALEKELERVIGLKVKIHAQGKTGSLTLFYQDLDQLDEVIKKLRA